MMASAALLAPLAAAAAAWLLLRRVPRLEAPAPLGSLEAATRTAAAEMEALAEAFRDLGRAVEAALPSLRLFASRWRDVKEGE